jgi:hypothetical protein
MHEKTFAAINKLKDIELELHRLKNALEMANKALDAQRPWVELTDEEIALIDWESLVTKKYFVQTIEAALRSKNT